MENLIAAFDNDGKAQNSCGIRVNNFKFQSLGVDEENEIWNLSGTVKDENGQSTSGGCTIAKTGAVFLIGIWKQVGTQRFNSQCLAKVEELQRILIDGGS